MAGTRPEAELPALSTTAPALRSVHREVSFPAIPEEAHAGMLALQYQYEDTERWPAEDIEAQQFRQLAELLTFADRSIPFWRERLRRAGLRGGNKLSRLLFSRLPILTQAEAQAAATRLRAPQIPPEHGNIVPIAGTGFTTSQVAQFFQISLSLRYALWQRMAMEEKLAILQPGPEGTPLPPPTTGRSWGEAFAPFVTGPSVSLDARHLPAEQFAWLAREEPAYLVTTASNILALAKAAQGTNPLPPSLRSLHTEWSPETEAAQAVCRQVFHLPLVATYGARGVGHVALPCPEQGNLHAISECARVEILNARNQPCAPGETGRLVVTPLHNFATPLLRLDTGDDAELGSPCECGRSLPVLARILPRSTPSAG